MRTGSTKARTLDVLWRCAIALSIVCFASLAHGQSPALPPVPDDVLAALKSLKKADSDQREEVFKLLTEKGDARLVPALSAYKAGTLLLTDGKLLTYGQRVTIDGKSVVPLIDAITGEPSPGSDGKPVYLPKPVLTDAIPTPRGASRSEVNDLIDALSLLHPDPTIRTESIRSAGERAAQAVPDPAEAGQFLDAMAACTASLNVRLAAAPQSPEAPAIKEAIAAMAAAKSDKPRELLDPVPTIKTAETIKSKLQAVADAVKANHIEDKPLGDALVKAIYFSGSNFVDQAEKRRKLADDLPKTGAALKRQLSKDSTGPFAPALKEAIASIDIVTGDEPTRIAAAKSLGEVATGRAANLLNKIASAAERIGDVPLHDAAAAALASANAYQTKVHFIEYTFAGLSLGSILVLLALGLSIIFGLMGVINMAQGEFMMVGAFTTYAVAGVFHDHFSSAYNYYLIAAVPAAFLVAGFAGFIAEWLVIRHLYGRPLETLLATWGIGLVLIYLVRREFGDNVSVAPPSWMEGGWEVAPDIVFPLNRVYIIAFCAICIAIVYFVVNGTKLGLLLRATTQNREMASALGVPTRRIDGLTFAFGAGLAGLAGVAVPLYDKINPDMGQSYIVDCFMVVVVGGVGKVAGAIWAGLGLGFIGKYLEPILGSIPSLASGSSVIGKVLVLCMIIVFLQWRPQGLFPPKGRNADA